MKKSTFIIAVLSLLLISALFIFFHFVEKENAYNWQIYSIWLVVFLSSCVLSLTAIPKWFMERVTSVIRADWQIIMFILAIAFATRILFLTTYPYVTLGDELRDAGWHGLLFRENSNRDAFAFGSYDGYGNFAPLVSYYFSLFFANSSLIYRLPSALAGILSIVMTYFIGRIFWGKLVGVAASILLTASVVHLHYSRTELVVISDSLLSLFIFLGVIFALRVRYGFFLAGLILGFTLHFYAGLRGMVASSVLFLLAYAVWIMRKEIKEKRKNNPYLRNFFLCLFLLGSAIVISVGPRINYFFRNQLFFRAGTLTHVGKDPDFIRKTFVEKVVYLTQSFERAFITYIWEPVSAHSGSYKGKLLSFPVNWLFVVGFVVLTLRMRKKRPADILMVWVIVAVSGINQVFVNVHGSDHRLLNILPLLSIIAAYGYEQLTNSISLRKGLCYFALAVLIFPNLVFYFLKRPSDLPFSWQDYVFQDISLRLKSSPKVENFILPPSDQPDIFAVEAYSLEALFYAYPKNAQLINKVNLLGILSGNMKGLGSVQVFTFEEIPELEFMRRREYKRSCQFAGLMPDYRCPIDLQGELKFYVYD